MVRMGLLFLAAMVGFASHAVPPKFEVTQEGPSAAQEQERLEGLNKATTLEEAMDWMTPDEIAELLGITEEEELYHPTASPVVRIEVSIRRQRLHLYVDGVLTHATVVSTGMAGYPTKTGCHSVKRMHRKYTSKKYNSPMPHSIFYYGGFALHGTFYEKHLGRPASHGCVRLARRDAAYIFDIVQQYGASRTLICVY